VALADGNGKLLAATLTDSLGQYRLESPAGGRFRITLSCIGYETLSFPINLYRDTTILLSTKTSRQQLKGIEVAGARPILEKQPDRIVFNVDRNITAAGSDGLELLRKVPGVKVSGDKIGIAGKGAVRVMVNGRLVRLSDTDLEDYLRSFAAADIRKIEVITAPAAQYDAEGNAGMINIVTKRDRNPGFSAGIQGGYKRNNFDNANLGGNIALNTGRWSLAANVNALKGRMYEGFESDVYFPQASWMLSDTGNYRQRSLNGSFNADYNLSKQSVIGVSYNYRINNSKGTDNVHNPYYSKSAAPDSVLRTYAVYDPVAVNHALNLHYITTLDTNGTKLTVDADYFTYNRRDTSNFRSNSFDASGRPTPWGEALYYNTARQVIHIYTLKADLEIPTRFARWMVGGKLNFIDNYSNAFYYRINNDRQHYDSIKSSEFSYRENTQALYISGVKEIKRWSIQAGLRGEYTYIRGYSYTMRQLNEQRYFKLFPAVLLSYKANADNEYVFNFSKRINRPSFWNLNPYKSMTTDHSYFEGNPSLQPEYTSNAELTHSYRDKLKSSFFLSITHNGFDNITFADPAQTTIYRTPVNFLSTYRYGISEMITLHPVPWLESTGMASLYHTSARSAVSALRDDNLFSAYLSLTNNFSLNAAKTLSAGLSAWYQFADMDHIGRTDPYYRVDAGVKALLLQKRLSITLAANDLFNTSMPTVYTTVNNIPQRYVNFQFQRSVSLSFTYKFGNKGMKEKAHKEGNLEERERVH
jgi:hypothetical protein